MYVLVFLLALGIFAGGTYIAATRGEWTVLAAGCASLVVALAAWPIALTVQQSRRDAIRELDRQVAPVHERLEQFSVMLNLISEQQLISERAKGVAFREKEREALRQAIQDDIIKGDYEAALALVDEMQESFGYKQEADRFRAEIQNKRMEVQRRLIGEAAIAIDRCCRAEQWQQALREAERLRSMFPDDEQVARLPLEIDARRQSHKRQLLESWNDAVARRDVDGSIEILKRLDLYLTPSEAEGMQETARSVFREKLNNLRTQFGVAVQDHNWAEAVRIGDIIMRDFPNTQMAKEVRENIDSLRQRAGVASAPGNGATAELARV